MSKTTEETEEDLECCAEYLEIRSEENRIPCCLEGKALQENDCIELLLADGRGLPLYWYNWFVDDGYCMRCRIAVTGDFMKPYYAMITLPFGLLFRWPKEAEPGIGNHKDIDRWPRREGGL